MTWLVLLLLPLLLYAAVAVAAFVVAVAAFVAAVVAVAAAGAASAVVNTWPAFTLFCLVFNGQLHWLFLLLVSCVGPLSKLIVLAVCLQWLLL